MLEGKRRPCGLEMGHKDCKMIKKYPSSKKMYQMRPNSKIQPKYDQPCKNAYTHLQKYSFKHLRETPKKLSKFSNIKLKCKSQPLHNQ